MSPEETSIPQGAEPTTAERGRERLRIERSGRVKYLATQFTKLQQQLVHCRGI